MASTLQIANVRFTGRLEPVMRTGSCGVDDGMGKLVFGMMQSLDGYVDGVEGGLEMPAPGPELHRHFNDHVRGLAGSLYGRRMYEVMRYWDEDQPEWDALEHDFAAAWRAQPKWVVSPWSATTSKPSCAG
jgi:hypothetical protein